MNEHPLARSTDPDTSHIAEAKLKSSGKWTSQKSQVLEWLREHLVFDDDCTLTPYELSAASGIKHTTCHKRLPDLAHDGLVRKAGRRICRITGEMAYTWCALTPEELARPVEQREAVQASLFADGMEGA